MNIVAYPISLIIGIGFSYVGFVFAMTGGVKFAYLVGGLLLAAHIGTFIYVWKKAQQGKGRDSAYVLALPLFLVWAVGVVLLVGYYILNAVYHLIANLFW